MLKKSLITVLVSVAFSCGEPKLKLITKAAYPDLTEQRLGQSSYYVKIPATMFIDEARGKEGQLGYGLWRTDSIKRYVSPSAFIEIEHGRPIGGGTGNDPFVETVRSNFLDKTVKWKITRTETGYYIALAYHGKLTLRSSSPTREGLDSMIAIVATLSTR